MHQTILFAMAISRTKHIHAFLALGALALRKYYIRFFLFLFFSFIPFEEAHVPHNICFYFLTYLLRSHNIRI